jgi:tRNA dimethylallyltransferase
MFERDCLHLLGKLFIKYSHVIITGGSGLYVNAITEGFNSLPDADHEIRKMLKESYEQNGIKFLQEKLKELDKDYFETVDKNNPQRMMRAIEVCLVSGKRYSDFLGIKNTERSFRSVFTGLALPKAELHERINKRVDKMIDDGLEEEVKMLLPHRNCNALQTVGYQEMFLYLDGEISLDGAIELIKKNTRSYAKRQMTWFRKRKDIRWFHPGDIASIVSHIMKVSKH